MSSNEKLPIWVFLAFSSINTRKAALWLIGSCLAFTLYCVPWVVLFAGNELVASLFLIDDWSWVAMMVPISIWYWLSLRWMDRHAAWMESKQKS